MDWSINDVSRFISESEGLDDADEFGHVVHTFANVLNVKDIINTHIYNINKNFARRAKVKLANLVVNPDRSGKIDIKYYVIQNYKWVEHNISYPFAPNDSVAEWARKLDNIVLDAANLLPDSPRDEEEDELSESLDDTDKFVEKDVEYWHRTFQSLYDEGGDGIIAFAIESTFQPLHVVEINADKNIITLTGYDGENALFFHTRAEARELATRKFLVGFDWDQQVIDWMRSRLLIKLNAIDNAFANHTVKDNPFLFEHLDDSDSFTNEEYWFRTFQSLLDEGGIEQVAHALRTHFPSDRVLEVGENYAVMAVTLEAASEDFRKLKIPFDPTQTLQDWLRVSFIPALQKAEREKEHISKEQHPLFFEATSPWGSEYKEWGWQALVIPAGEAQAAKPGEGLDDADEFMTGDEPWLVTVTNKHIPGKELKGVVGWERGEMTGHFPKVFSLDRNDFAMSEDFAKKVIWGAYWAAEETTEGRTSYEPFELDTYLVGVGRDGEELLKYINDPENYGKKDYPSKLSGWTNIGTHTYGEQLMREDNAFTVTLGGRPFTKLHEVDLINIQMGAWHWPSENDTRRAPGASNFLYSDAETIMDVYPEMFIYWAPAVDLNEFYNQPHPLAYTPPAHEGSDLDDTDEFEEDDPEIDLQKWEDAERLGATAARNKMVAEAQTLLPEMKRLGLELLFVGAGPGVEHKRELRPFIIIGRKKSMTESLDDKDEFGDQMIPVSVTIVYNPLEVGQPPHEVIEIAKMIVIEYGFTPGEFLYKNPRWQPTSRADEMRLFGTLEVDGDLVDWLEEEGGQLELSTSYSDTLIKRGNITLILESEEAWLRHQGIDA